jgi:hypothetical protein
MHIFAGCFNKWFCDLETTNFVDVLSDGFCGLGDTSLLRVPSNGVRVPKTT